jgi:peptidoglycan/LPS O-acetylase OafA/YrhL
VTDHHRNDIDGLRAISVLGVLLYHLGFRFAPGGFVGVDVFFVISGYLISAQILASAAAGRFSVLGFYERRVRRILPAFFFTTAVTMVAAWLLLLPAELIEFVKSAAASLVFAGNIYFWSVAGYFGPTAQDQPLLHYWSLGVEEQFYILFPIVVICVGKARKPIAGVLAALTVASLVCAELAVRRSPEWAFYLLPARAWEMLIGGLLALPRFPVPTGPRVGLAASTLGIAMILLGMTSYSDSTRFPGVSALLPCLGAIAVLWGGLVDNPVARMLGRQPLRYLGLISYSLYLVHWPMIVFVNPDSVGKKILVIAASIALAAVSYQFVEQPVRLNRIFWTRTRVLTLSPLLLALMLLVSGGIHLSNGFPGRLPDNVQEMLSYNHYAFSALYREGTCFLRPDQPPDEFDEQACIPSNSDIILWGDSHAAHYYPGLNEVLRQGGTSLGQLTASACAPLAGRNFPARPNCKPFNTYALQTILKAKPRIVLLSASWLIDPLSIKAFEETIDTLTKAGLQIVVLGDGQMYRSAVPNLLAKRMLRGDLRTKSSNDDLDDLPFKVDQILQPAIPVGDFISILRLICPQHSCPMMTPSGVPMLWDRTHLTEEGSVFVAERLAPKILDILAKSAARSETHKRAGKIR